MLPLCSAALLVTIAGCAPAADQQQSKELAQLETSAKEIAPRVERAVGLKFKRPPRVALRSKEQVRKYIGAKLDSDYPPAELAQVTAAYRLFRMIPDSLDMRALFLDLYAEQVVGFFDQDSSTLYVVEQSDPTQVRLILLHELVHALQDQHVPLDSILSSRGNLDRRNAAQAVMEGQAMLASLVAMMPEQDVLNRPELMEVARQQARDAQDRMPVFKSAPLYIREGLVFPYLDGMEFMRVFALNNRDTVPFGPRLPESTEQILHPDRYRAGDRPVELQFSSALKPSYQDNLGELETRLLLQTLSGSEAVGAAGAAGWAGDRYGVFAAGGGSRALVWWTVWDTEAAAKRFLNLFTREWPKGAKAGRKFTIEALKVGSRPAVRLVDAPPAWAGWKAIPAVKAETPPRK